ncbi:hypothetical protein LY28_02936 [Ruminiclostridium sufflavum DSM 19573]|uniref:GIY-YIG domain-containing protein n=1 Tax=Ruminiclostridium sufflavum DSM 19573 TaxID=1121337 RepID=A0A318XHD7_9FIRM|nr:hypothetical protein [Ruminiclostridium sufflavum]PYG86595.1 hypothetical protein LY28_02936 [Ruminiclostridium sufflavum DSM 19573]
MIKVSSAYISDTNISHMAPYLYFISFIDSRNNGYLYVGETCERFGALGRLARHLSYENSQNRNGATFLNNIQKYGCISSFSVVKDLSILAVDLREYGMFDGDANRIKRMGLEFLVRSEMQAFSSDGAVVIPYEVISTAKKNKYSSKLEFEKIAKEIIKEIAEKIVFMTGNIKTSSEAAML